MRAREHDHVPAGSDMAARAGSALVCVLDDLVALEERGPFGDATTEDVVRPHRGETSVGELVARLVAEALTTITSTAHRTAGPVVASTATDLASEAGRGGGQVLLGPASLLPAAGLLGPQAIRVVVTAGRAEQLRGLDETLSSAARSSHVMARTVVVLTSRPETPWCRAQLVVLGGLTAGVINAFDLKHRRPRQRALRDLTHVLSTLPTATWPAGVPHSYQEAS